MGRHEHYEDRSGDSAFLEAFRKRKNERLMSELELSNDNDVPSSHYSGNYRSSAYNDPMRDDGRQNSAQPAENQSYSRSPQGNRAGAGIRSNPEPIYEDYLPPLPSNNISGVDGSQDAFDSMNDDFEDDMGWADANASAASPADSDIAKFSDMGSDTADFSAVKNTSDSQNADKNTSSHKSSSKGKKDGKQKGKKGIFVFILLALIAGVIVYVIKQNQEDITVDPYDTVSEVSSFEEDPFVFSSVASDEISSESPDHTSSTAPVSSTVSDPAIPEDIVLSVGSEGEEVLKMQKRLCELGYLSKESCTGYYGNFTKKRVQMFQEYAKMKQTGIADKKTLDRLYASDAPYCQ